MEHDYIRNLKSQSCKQMSSYCRKDSAGLGIRGSGSIPTRGNILSLDFFSRSKASDANVVIIANFVIL